MCTFKVIEPYPGDHPHSFASAWVNRTYETNEDLAKFIRMQRGLDDNVRVYALSNQEAMAPIAKAGEFAAANYWEKRFGPIIVLPEKICQEVSPRR